MWVAPGGNALFATMTYVLVVCVVSFLFVGFSTSSPISRWFVNETGRTLPPPHDYSRYFASLQRALDFLAVANKTNVTIVLAAGEHGLHSKVDITGANGITIVSEGGDRGTADICVITAHNRTVTDPQTPIVGFSASHNIVLSNLKIEMLTQGTMFVFKGCVGVTVKDCRFTTLFSLGTVLFFVNTIQLRASGCIFRFDVPTVDTSMPRKTGNVTLFYFLINDTETAVVNNDQLAMSMSNCRFESRSSSDALETAGYRDIGGHRLSPLQQEALLVVLIYGSNVRGLRVTVSHCYVSGLLFGLAVPIALVVDEGASRNSITISNSQVTDNSCLSGCGILVWFVNKAAGNGITISDTVFTNNTAEVEGGAIFVLLENAGEGNVLAIDRCDFANNKADTLFGGGASAMIYSNRDPDRSGSAGTFQKENKIEFKNCTFRNNIADRAAIYTKDTEITFSGNCDFVNNSGGAIYAYRSKVTIRGGHHTFINNTGAIYGGAISLQRWSSIAFLDVESVRFVDNVAKVFGGAIWADQTSSSESYIELLNDISGITTSVGCFIELNSSLQFNYGNSNSSAKIHFYNNSAPLGGRDVYAATFRLCSNDAVSPANLSVGNNTYPISSSPYLMTFESASCKCIKDNSINGSMPEIFNAGQCNRRAVAKRVNASADLASLSESLHCWKTTASFIYSRAFPSRQNSSLYLPDSFLYEYMYVPFATCILGHYLELGRSAVQEYLVCSAPVQPSSLTLCPAPGETFSLRLNSWNEFLNLSTTVATITVLHISRAPSMPPEALLRHSGTEYKMDDGPSFDLRYAINDLSLAGPVNASGYLRVEWPSYLRGLFCELFIPFNLSSCHPGFNNPEVNMQREWAAWYISQAETRPVSEAKASSRMVCSCSRQPGLTCREDGKTVEVMNDYWAGYVKGSELVTHQCVGHCAKETFKPSSNPSTWLFDRDKPNKHCAPFRSGVLCGRCRANYSETPATTACQHCEDSWVSGLVGTLCYIVIGGILFIFLSMKFHLLSSQYVEAWIFYEQVAVLLVRPEEEYSFLSSVTHSSFDVLAFCVHPHLTELDRLLVDAVPSLYLIFLVAIVFAASYARPFSKYIQRAEVTNTFLLVVIVAYAPLATAACFWLSCSVRVGGDVRLFADPTEICFSDNHLPYAIASIILLTAFLIPLPGLLVYAVRGKNSARTGWFYRLAKLCTGRYKESRQWWIGVTLWRRLFLTGVAAVVPSLLETRQVVLFVATLLLFFLSALSEPYKSKNANRFEIVLLANMCLLAALSINEPDRLSTGKQTVLPLLLAAIVGWPTVGIISIAIYKNRDSLKRLYRWFERKFRPESSKMKSSKSSSSSIVSNAESTKMKHFNPDKSAGLRDPLLLDFDLDEDLF